jgi:predicted ATP-grasp superfamily ATP-dependent carboligase
MAAIEISIKRNNWESQLFVYARYCSCSIAVAHNTAREELEYHQTFVFVSTGAVLPDERGQYRRFETALLNM